MRFDRRRTRGVALVLAAVVLVVAGAGGGLAVADHGPPAATQIQGDNVTEDDADGGQTGDAADPETQTETETPGAQTPEPDATDAGEAAAASEETKTATETSSSTATQTATPASSDDAVDGDETTPGDAATTESPASSETDSSASEEDDASVSAENDTSTSGESDASADGELADCTEITEPGAYELTADVDGSGTCIDVRSSGVTLDGNGHTVAGSGSGTGIHVAGGTSDVTVRNVDVSDWGVAVELGGSGASGPTANLVEVRATESDTGVRLVEADDSAMQAVTARDNGDGVVLVDTAGVQASDVTVTGNDGTGLWLARGVSESSFSIVQATDNGEQGIHVATGAVDNFVGDATVTDNGGAGVEFADSSNNVLADSRVERNGGPGVLSYPAGGDRLENVRLADNGDGAYRDRAERAGAVADTVELRDGATVRFEQGVTHLAATDAPESVPEGTTVAGLAVDVTLRDGGSATVTVPVDASDDVTAYQRVDGSWEEIAGVSASDGRAEIPVSGSGVVVPVVEPAEDGATETEDGTTGAGDDTVRADTSADDGAASSDEDVDAEPASSDESVNDGAVASDGDGSADSASAPPASENEAGDGPVANEAPGEEGDAAAGGPGDAAVADSDATTDEYALGDDEAADAETPEATVDRTDDGVEMIVVESAGDEAATDYTLLVDGNVSKVTDGDLTADANDTISRTNGALVVDGSTATADAYLVEGQLRGVCGTLGTPGFSLEYGDVDATGDTPS